MDDALRARTELNGHGCAFGQVNRERIDNAMRDMRETKRLIQYVLGAVLVQLLVFAFATFWFVANRAIP